MTDNSKLKPNDIYALPVQEIERLFRNLLINQGEHYESYRTTT